MAVQRMQQDTTSKEQEFRESIKSILVHFSDKSTKWLLQNTENVRGLIEIIDDQMGQLIDFNQLEEQKRSFMSDRLEEQESDLLFTVPFKNGDETDKLIIYILIEHQSTVDVSMGYRLLFYMMNIWQDQRRGWIENKVPKSAWRLRPVLPIVLYTGDRPWQVPITLSAIMDIPKELDPFVPKFETLLLSVKETETETLIKTDHPFGWLLTVLQQEKSDKQSLIRAMEEAMRRFKTLDPEQRSQALHYLIMFVTSRRRPEENQELTALIQQHANDMEVEIMAETMADFLIEQGDKQGFERGSIHTKQNDVIKLLTHQFPDVSAPFIDEVREIKELSQLGTLFDQILAAKSFDDIDWNGIGNQ